MNRVFHHLLVPALFPALFFAVASTPVEVFGCRNRGVLAVGIALTAGLLGIGAAAKALIGRRRGDPSSKWWVATALILAVPAACVVVLARRG